MWKKLALTTGTVLLFAFCLQPAEAFWHWHHHRVCCTAAPAYYYAAPQAAYYAAPQAAPQAAPSSQIIELLLPIFADLVRSRLGQGQITTTTTQPSSQTDLAGLKGDLAQIAASLENTNSTLRRHGEEIVNLRLDLAAMKGDVDTIKTLVGSGGTLQKDVKDILDKLPRQTKQELLAALTANELFIPVNSQTKLTEAERSALVAGLTEKIKAVLDRHYGGQ